MQLIQFPLQREAKALPEIEQTKIRIYGSLTSNQHRGHEPVINFTWKPNHGQHLDGRVNRPMEGTGKTPVQLEPNECHRPSRLGRLFKEREKTVQRFLVFKHEFEPSAMYKTTLWMNQTVLH